MSLADLEAAMVAGVTFGSLPVGARFHFPGFPATVYVKTTARKFRAAEVAHGEVLLRRPAAFTTGAKTAVIAVSIPATITVEVCEHGYAHGCRACDPDGPR